MIKYFSTNTSFQVVEKYFLTIANHLLHICFSEATRKKVLFPSSGKIFLNDTFSPTIGEGFSL